MSKFRLLALLMLVVFEMRAQDIAVRVHASLPQARLLFPQNQILGDGWFVCLPGFSTSYGNSGFSYNDIVRSEGDSSALDYPNMIDQLDNVNYISAGLNLHAISIGRKFGFWQVSFDRSRKLGIYLQYRKELAQLLYYGNAPFVGEALNLSPALRAQHYQEHGITVSRSVQRWTIGGSLRILQGISVIDLSNSSIRFVTKPVTYDVQVQTDLLVNTAGLDHFTDFFHQVGFQNPGIAIDFGASYQVREKLKLSASLMNVGRIYWKEDPQNYRLESDVTFEGFDISGFITNDTVSPNTYIDSIRGLLVIDTSQNPFWTRLSPRMHASVTYMLNELWLLDGLFRFQTIHWSRPQMLASVSIARQFEWKRHFFQPAIHYSYRNRSPLGIGCSFFYRWNWLQVYIGGDNMLSWLSPKAYVPLNLFDKASTTRIIVPKNFKTMNFRFGLNILIVKAERG